jgi:hemoglobin/transferrin/lactoferrin receptor protein
MANQNKRRAYICGFNSQLKAQLNNRLLLSGGINYTYGRIQTDSMEIPLDHIPPFMANASVDYQIKKLSVNFSVQYNGKKRLKDYLLNGEDNEQYATPDGMPGWICANIRLSYTVSKLLKFTAGIDNILDTQYRTFASGINAPGRNFFLTLRLN